MLLRAALSARTRSAPRPLKPLGAVRCASHGPVGYGSGAYRGLKIPKVAAFHQNVATVMGTILWLWIFYRAKNDGPAMLVRARSPKPAHSPLAAPAACSTLPRPRLAEGGLARDCHSTSCLRSPPSPLNALRGSSTHGTTGTTAMATITATIEARARL